jgi:hypothetical protein
MDSSVFQHQSPRRTRIVLLRQLDPVQNQNLVAEHQLRVHHPVVAPHRLEPGVPRLRESVRRIGSVPTLHKNRVNNDDA